MGDYDLQRDIVNAIKIVVNGELSKNTHTSSLIGIIKDEPIGFDCVVTINGQDMDCQLPEHLHTWIQKNDIVIVQDLYGNGSKKVVTGKTGSVNPSPSLVFHDEALGKNISGRDMVFDEQGNKMDTFGTIQEG